MLALGGVRDRLDYVRALVFPDEAFRVTRGTPRRSARWKRTAGWMRDAIRRTREP
jgi:hypothetical protein